MTNLNDHIKQQQEVNRGKYATDNWSESSLQHLDTVTADTIKQTLEWVWKEMLKLVDDPNEAIYLEEIQEALTQLEDSKK